MEKNIVLKEYILKHCSFKFCDMQLFQFDSFNETILINRSYQKCNQSLEDFIIQSLLVQCCEDDYMKEEYISIKDNRIIDLDSFLFSKEVGGKKKFSLYQMKKTKGIELLQTWIIDKNLKKLNISFDRIKYFLIIDELDSMYQEIIFEDDKYRFFLSRGLG